MKLLEDADVFLTNLLPPARKPMSIDAASIRARFPNIIYASGSGSRPERARKAARAAMMRSPSGRAAASPPR